MIRRKDSINKEYLYYLMNDVGLLNDYDLHEIGIGEEELEDPDDETLDKIEYYRDKYLN